MERTDVEVQDFSTYPTAIVGAALVAAAQVVGPDSGLADELVVKRIFELTKGILESATWPS